ncbi:MAG: hypothetical protein QOF58_7922 [Pseudonocardiales bacterium]|nr:hypothetical protein [Pseudonocardiales bacterium]
MTDRDGHKPLIRVLIVDNDARVRGALRTFLEAHPGFEVVGEAGSAAPAIELAHQLVPCVAIVDVLMPDAQDGLELLTVLARDHGIPVIAMSLRSALAESTIDAGAHTFLPKDGYSDRLLTALRAAHHGESI